MSRSSSPSGTANSVLAALPPKWRAILVLVAIVGALGYHFWDRSQGGKGLGIFAGDAKEAGRTGGENTPANSGVGAPAGSGTAQPVEKMGGFDVLRGARLVDYRNNDGDSFLIEHGGKQHEVRLYFVDAPEKRRHQYNGERIGHQARYFGIGEDEVLEVGIEAKALVAKLLGTGTFTVYTKWDEVFESDRYFVFVEIANPDGEGTSLLCEELTEAGLSRIYTEGTTLPNGESEEKFEAHLKGIERDAKREKRGGWGR